MLVRDVRRGAAGGIEVFLMHRHAAVEFVGGVMVFPGGGVDDRDRGALTPGRSAPAPEDAPIAWFGPEPPWWADRLGVDEDLAEALVCAAARETF